MANPSDRLFDRRVVERNLRRGLIDRETLRRFIDTLPDRADNVAVVQVSDGDQGGAGTER